MVYLEQSDKFNPMHILIVILLVIAGFVALLLIVAAFMTKEHHVKREIIIHAPRLTVLTT